MVYLRWLAIAASQPTAYYTRVHDAAVAVRFRRDHTHGWSAARAPHPDISLTDRRSDERPGRTDRPGGPFRTAGSGKYHRWRDSEACGDQLVYLECALLKQKIGFILLVQSNAYSSWQEK